MAIRVLLPKVIPIPEQPHFGGDDAMATALRDAIAYDVHPSRVIPFIDDVATDGLLRSRRGGGSECVISVDPVREVICDAWSRELPRPNHRIKFSIGHVERKELSGKIGRG